MYFLCDEKMNLKIAFCYQKEKKYKKAGQYFYDCQEYLRMIFNLLKNKDLDVCIEYLLKSEPYVDRFEYFYRKVVH